MFECFSCFHLLFLTIPSLKYNWYHLFISYPVSSSQCALCNTYTVIPWNLCYFKFSHYVTHYWCISFINDKFLFTNNSGDHPEDVKARLKYWAQAVACTIRLCSWPVLASWYHIYMCVCVYIYCNLMPRRSFSRSWNSRYKFRGAYICVCVRACV